jgi:trans-aconitate methyltransferase
MQAVLDQIKLRQFDSLLDVGCGDGRFLREVSAIYPEKRILGVDYSDQAIHRARAFNPHIEYKCVNILNETLQEDFDIITLIETLEHIPLGQVPRFLEQLRKLMKPNGTLIICVPHSNLPIQMQHYQHFNSGSLDKLLSPLFAQRHYIPIDSKSYFIRGLHRLLGGAGRHFVITNRFVLRHFYRLYRRRFLYVSESNCMHIVAVCS